MLPSTKQTVHILNGIWKEAAFLQLAVFKVAINPSCQKAEEPSKIWVCFGTDWDDRYDRIYAKLFWRFYDIYLNSDPTRQYITKFREEFNSERNRETSSQRLQ